MKSRIHRLLDKLKNKKSKSQEIEMEIIKEEHKQHDDEDSNEDSTDDISLKVPKMGNILKDSTASTEEDSDISEINDIANELLKEIESPAIFSDDTSTSVLTRINNAESSLSAINSILEQAISLNDNINELQKGKFTAAEPQLQKTKDTLERLTTACIAAKRKPDMLLRQLKQLQRTNEDLSNIQQDAGDRLKKLSKISTKVGKVFNMNDLEHHREHAKLWAEQSLSRLEELAKADPKPDETSINDARKQLGMLLQKCDEIEVAIQEAPIPSVTSTITPPPDALVPNETPARTSPAPHVPAANDKYYFFATTPEEYKQQRNKVVTLAQNFSSAIQVAERAEQAALKLAHSPTLKKNRGEVLEKLDNQIHELKLLRGILQDNVRRRENINVDPHDSSRVRTPEWIDTPVNGSLETIRKNIQRIENCIEKLEAARSGIQNIAEASPEQTVYYSRRSDAQEFGNDRNAAITAINHYFSSYNRAAPTGDKSMTLHINEGAAPTDKLLKSANYRFIPMDVATKTGSAPVGVLQETNDSKTYARQQIFMSNMELANLNKLPQLSEAKEQKLMEQMLFIANIVETALAATNASGPVSVKNMPENLSKAAAAYCQRMGYDFNQKSITDNLKPKDKAMYNMVTDKLMKENNEFAKMVQDAEARRELKKGYLPPAPKHG